MTDIFIMWFRSIRFLWDWALVLIIPYYVYQFLIGDGPMRVVYYTRCKMKKPIWDTISIHGVTGFRCRYCRQSEAAHK